MPSLITTFHVWTGHWEHRDVSRWPNVLAHCPMFLFYLYNYFLLLFIYLPSQCAKVIISDCGIP